MNIKKPASIDFFSKMKRKLGKIEDNRKKQ